MLVRRYGYYVLLTALAMLLASIWLIASQGISLLAILMIGYSVVVGLAGVYVCAMGKHTL